MLKLQDVKPHTSERIAIVSHTHPSISKGGAEIAAYTLFRGLTELGLDPIFIAACSEKDRPRLALGSVNEHAVYYDPNIYDNYYHVASPDVLRQLEDIVTANRIGVINFHHFLNFGIGSIRHFAARSALRTFVTLHEFLPICHHHGQMITRPHMLLCDRATFSDCASCFPEHSRQQFALRKDLFLNSFRAVDGFISPSRFLATRFEDWGLPSERIAVIENGLDAHLARESKTPSDTNVWTFGFFGQINPFKGVGLLLDAANLISKDIDLAQRINIRIHGNLIGQSEAFVTKFQEALKQFPFLSYAGPYNNSSVGRLMGDCDYVLTPSTWWENSPVVIQEAYAARRPVICTGIGGMAEKVPDGVSGLQFKRGDSADLVRVLTLAADRDTFGRLQAGIPPVMDAIGMAQCYLDKFAHPPEPKAEQVTKDTAATAGEARVDAPLRRRRLR
jgi:glycosyltransferase involved in cell wall biosynthesis